jgi:transcriptional regulator with XRE-family HTH domain
VDSVTAVLGQRVRRLRQRKGWTQTELAQRALSNKTTISDIELGRQVPDAGQVEKLEAALDADGVIKELHGLLSIGIQESAVVADVERDALAITLWELRGVPGLLQTADYARAQLRVSVPVSRLEREVSIRMGRQRVLHSLLSGWFILSEAVLHVAYGGREVMRDQLLALETLAERPNLHMQVMPFTMTDHPGGDGPLTVIEYQDKPSLWITEGPRSGRMSDDRAEVINALTSLNLVRSAALPLGESVEFIRNLRETRYDQ